MVGGEQLELDVYKRQLHGLDLGIAAHAGHRDAGVDCRHDTGVEQLLSLIHI